MKKILPITHKKGFTLIELLVVIAIIATLAVLVFVALNPATRLEDARDARRVSDVNSILTAIHEAIVDNDGSNPTNMPAAGVIKQLGTATDSTCALTVGAGGGNCTATSTGCVDLMANVAIDLIPYLASMPIDPLGTGGGYAGTDTGYTVVQDANGIVTITACAAENTTVSASR